MPYPGYSPRTARSTTHTAKGRTPAIVLVGRTPAIVLVPQASRTAIATPHTTSASTTSEKIKTKLAILCGFNLSPRGWVPSGVRARLGGVRREPRPVAGPPTTNPSAPSREVLGDEL